MTPEEAAKMKSFLEEGRAMLMELRESIIRQNETITHLTTALREAKQVVNYAASTAKTKSDRDYIWGVLTRVDEALGIETVAKSVAEGEGK